MKKLGLVLSGFAVLTVIITALRLSTTPPSVTAAHNSSQPDLPEAPPALELDSAPPAVPDPAAVTNAVPPKTVRQRIAESDTTVFKLAPEQIHAFLARNGTNAESLLAAFNVSSDKEFLREAARRYPSNAFVLASVLTSDAMPEQRRELLDQFKQTAPDNPLANYLSARDHLKAGQPELALQEFADAAGKTGFHDFTVERIQGLEEIYLGAGYSAAESKALAMTSVQLPAVSQLRGLGRDMSGLMKQYAAGGDTASAETLAGMGLDLAANIRNTGGNSLLAQMVGVVVEREFLGGLDPTRTYDFMPMPVSDRLTQLRAQDTSIRDAAKFFDHWMNTADEAHLVSYFDRLKLYGEAAALDWARGQIAPAF